MNNNEPNKIVSKLYNRYKKLKTPDALSGDKYWDEHKDLSTQLANITNVIGAIKLMSKTNIIRLCAMQSSLRFMALHSFMMVFSNALEEIEQ